MPGQYQSRPYFCAPAALQCALACLGIPVGQGKLAAAIGITEDGADEDDILGAVVSLGLRPDVIETDSRQEARTWLHERASLHPTVLCVDNWDHWVCLAGQCNDRLFLFDPAREVWNTTHRGGWPLTAKTVLRRWGASRRLAGDSGRYYGIGVIRP